ncbi:Sds3-like protein [Myxozyma melibiosi]|uniref:Sds3-like protein n=1 Tax=Myxozyma melibiosi TaxID=54550 RepID=A0ABR1F4Q2_9ASCO
MDLLSPGSTPSPPPSGLLSSSAAASVSAAVSSYSTGGAAAYPASSKRDRRRHNMSERYNALTALFAAQKDVIYRDSLGELQATLGSLHAGTDPVFLEALHDIEEARDSELVTLYLNQEFLLERAEKEYRRDVDAANEEYEDLARSVREHLLNRLEMQRRKLREDRELLDIANDHSLLLSVSGYNGSQAGGSGGASSGRDTGDGGHSYGSQGPDSPGGASSSGGAMGSVGERRKNLRRRGDLIPTSAAAESSSMLSKKRKRNGQSSGGGSGFNGVGERDEIAAFWSDREALPFGQQARADAASGGGERGSGSGGRHREKAFGGLVGLKSEEVGEDLAILRKKKKRK